MKLIDADAIVVPCDFRIEHFHDRIDEHVAYDLGSAVKKLIDAQPTVDPIKHGHWKPYEYGDYHWHECSVCKVADYYITDVTRFNGTVDTLVFRREYCPHCGAKMDEVEE